MSATAAGMTAGPTRRSQTFMSTFGSRQLDYYPDTAMRIFQLALVILVTVILYYENYVGGGVGPQVLGNLHMSFSYYVTGLAIANLAGAFASIAAGLADRFGRANLVVYGVLITGAIMLFLLPNAHSKGVFIFETIVIGLVEGIVLVATPALVRDFSPQVGRATAMGFWTMGPVLGSLVVSFVATQTLPKVNPDWQGQYQICGVVGIVVFALALVGLRELSPNLRDQLMVSLRERELIEARAKGLDIEASLRHPWRQMLHLDIVVSAIGIALMLLIYYTAVAFGVIYLETVLNFTANQANGISNWDWGADAVALLIVGLLSDRIRVRKPFMVVGGAATAVMIVIFLLQSKPYAAGTHPSYYKMVVIVALLAAALACAFAPWMASFTETVEAHNPALTATGLAIWGWVIRVTIFLAFIILPHVVTSTNPLVNYGTQVAADAKQYAPQLATAAKLTPATSAALAANPNNAQTQVAALSEISGVPQDQVALVVTSSTQYAAQLATAAKLDAATTSALAANPNDVAAQVKALSEISGVPASDVATIVRLQTQDAAQIATLQAVDTQTQVGLFTKAPGAAAKAVGEIAQKFGISAAAATARLQAATSIPVNDLLLLQSDGPKVLAAANSLKALAAVPTSALTALQAHGPAVQAAATQLKALATVPPSVLAFLQAHAAAVQKAVKDTPHQWRTWYWICFAGAVLFIPATLLMKGRWSPKKAREDAEAHERRIQAELAALHEAAAHA